MKEPPFELAGIYADSTTVYRLADDRALVTIGSPGTRCPALMIRPWAWSDEFPGDLMPERLWAPLEGWLATPAAMIAASPLSELLFWSLVEANVHTDTQPCCGLAFDPQEPSLVLRLSLRHISCGHMLTIESEARQALVMGCSVAPLGTSHVPGFWRAA